MKKVFAFLSTLLLTIAFVGIFAVKSPVAAGKITADPTLEKDEIPVYIMSSIYTTFPNYYDNEAKVDENWGGASRMYPWNETRLRVAQLDAAGNPTGKYYAVYFAGHTAATNADGSIVVGAGKNILSWALDDEGNVVLRKYSDGKMASSGAASDPSLSHMRSNTTGQDLEFIPTDAPIQRVYRNAEGKEVAIMLSTSGEWKDGSGNVVTEEQLAASYYTGSSGDEGKNFYNRSIVFNAEGQIVRGIALDDVYTAAAGDGVKFAPEYCYVDGVVTKIDANTTCDKVKVPATNEDGENLTDENGEIIYVDGEEDNKIYSRFVWEYFEEQPENVNEVPYLSDGWNPDLWDYCYPSGEGYMCIAFVGSADGTHNVKGDQVAAYQDYLVKYEGLDEATAKTQAANHARACVATLRVPAGGWTFDYGYLDKGTSNDQFFNETVIYGYLYGRTLLNKVERGGNKTEELIGMAEQRTYDFSVTGLTFTEKVVDGQSYRLLNGENTVEVMMGSEFNATQFINYNGVMRYWGTQDDLTSYSSNAEVLEFYVKESKNGGNLSTVVAPPAGYTSLEDIKNDFLADLSKFKGKEVRFDNAANFHADAGWAGFVATSSANAELNAWSTPEGKEVYTAPFFNALIDPEGEKTLENSYRGKWGWLVEQIYQTMLAFPGGDTYAGSLSHLQTTSTGAYCGSPQTIHYAIWYFLSGQTHGYFGFNFGPAEGAELPNSALWIDSATSKDKWGAYRLDATMAAPDDNWVVEYTVLNSVTGVSQSLTIKYVVVDSYTPVLKVNANNLYYSPKEIGDLVECSPIDKYSVVTAYSGQYNGVSILGNDISHRIEFDTELDFANPKEGKYPVVATVWNNAGTKKAVVEFTITVADITAPNVTTRKVVLQQGDLFDCRDGIVTAIDNVDGDLTKLGRKWWVEETDPIDTIAVFAGNNAGKDYTTEVQVTVFDSSYNERLVKFTVVVVADKYVASEITDSFEELADQVAGLEDIVNDIYDNQESQAAALENLKKEVAKLAAAVSENAVLNNDNVEELKTSIEEVATKVATVQTSVDALAVEDEGGCKSGALLVLQLASAATLLALVLRKKH